MQITDNFSFQLQVWSLFDGCYTRASATPSVLPNGGRLVRPVSRIFGARSDEVMFSGGILFSSFIFWPARFILCLSWWTTNVVRFQEINICHAEIKMATSWKGLQ
jgi:hypothetical protein